MTINKVYGCSVSVYRKDYCSMLDGQWLRTQAVDVLIKLLLEDALLEVGKIYAGRGIFD